MRRATRLTSQKEKNVNEDLLETLRNQTIAVILACRSEYLAAGASPLKHWSQIQDRVRAAARQASSVPNWVTAVARTLGLGAPDAYRAEATGALHGTVQEHDCASRWLDLVEEEHGYLMAAARLEAEQRRERREEKAELKQQADSDAHDGLKGLR